MSASAKTGASSKLLSAMAELQPSPVDFRFYNVNGARVAESDDPLFGEITAEIDLIGALHREIIDTLAVEKPEWFVSAELEARKFLASLGFDSNTEIYLLKEGEAMDALGLREPQTTVAETGAFVPHILVRNSRIETCREAQGEEGVASVLVHELAHATVDTVDAVGVELTREDLSLHLRSGWIVTHNGSNVGEFPEEAFGTFVGAWYRRSRENPLAPCIGITHEPERELPDYLQPFDPSMISGPDGYAFELLAWGAEQRGIMSSSDFVAMLLETRRPETRIVALRAFAQTVERIEPGLYTALQKLHYSKQSWLEGCDRVYEAVMRSEWEKEGVA
jgi:hypothetical protein